MKKQKEEYINLIRGAKRLKKLYKKMDLENALFLRKAIYLTQGIPLKSKDMLWSFLNGDLKYRDLTKDL